MWFLVTKKTFNKTVSALQEELLTVRKELEEEKKDHESTKVEYSILRSEMKEMLECYPLELGMTVYDVQLRNSAGKYTKTKASREQSLINEVVVTKKNYFGLVDRYRNNDVFVTEEAAKKHLDNVCIE